MFRYEGGLKLLQGDLAVDFRRRQPRGFISHAHSDHMARHMLALCTPHTARLYQFRLGRREVLEMPYRKPLEWGEGRLTTFPAGHCLGSAMLLAEDGKHSMLYTGDFKLGESLTSERAELPKADWLVIESTYGDPRYRLRPRLEVIEEFLDLVRDALRLGKTPVIQAYVLGKGQEVTKILTSAGIPVLQHRKVFEVSQVYMECGVDLGNCSLYPGRPLEGHAVIVPPQFHRRERLPGLKQKVDFAVTGWAVDEGTRWKWRVDHAIPLSDHADYDELFEAIARVEPRRVYCTHGPIAFVDRVREAGFDACRLEEAPVAPI